MTTIFPFRFYQIDAARFLVSSDAGDFFLTTGRFVDRLAERNLTPADEAFLLRKGFAFEQPGDLYFTSHVARLRARKRTPRELRYVIAIPTLRCQMSCRYCQVSRADLNADGYDWSEEHVIQFIQFLDAHGGNEIKVEFQGGEPTLRIDIIRRVIEFCDRRFKYASYVICTHLGHLTDEQLDLFAHPRISLSTSVDGPTAAHTRNRTGSEADTRRVWDNILLVRDRFGSAKIAALPTITPDVYGDIAKVIEAYAALGFSEVYLRPVHFHGFARKQFSSLRSEVDDWLRAYESAVRHLFHRNENADSRILEYNLALALKRIFHRGYNGHVDLRTPSPVGQDYVVVNFDGSLYPSDEARMLSRIGLVDLRIGSVADGLDDAAVRILNWNNLNDVHEDCIHCAFQPYCGADAIDDVARYSRINVPKHLTWFCKWHTFLFELAFKLIAENDPVVLANLNFHLTGRYAPTPFYRHLSYDPA